MFHRPSGAAAVVACAGLALGACGTGSSGGDVSKRAGVDHIQIAVGNYGAGAFGVPQLIAQKEGIFRRNRIAIDRVVSSAGGGTTVRLLLSGKLAFADSAVAATVLAALKGTPLKIVGGANHDNNDSCVLTRSNEGVKTLKDLAGKTLSYSNPGSASEGFIRLAAARSGVPATSFRYKATGGLSEGVTLLKQHQVDQAIGLGSLCRGGGGLQPLPDASRLVPSFQQSVVITTGQMLQRNPDLVRRYLLSLQQAERWISANPDRAAVPLAELTEQPLAPTRQFVRSLLSPMHWKVGLDATALNAALRGAVLSGAIDRGTQLPWSKILDQRFLPAGASRVDPATLSTR
jgi:NitT/TauT family transport system substrate-binding protein